MECVEVEERLLEHALGVLEADEQDAIDAHLLECRACLRAYFGWKRATARGAAPRPSKAVRERLRRDVAKTFGASVPPERVSLLRRRIPAYQGLVAAVLAAAVTLFVVDRFARGTAHPGAPEIDTSRPRAVSLEIY